MHIVLDATIDIFCGQSGWNQATFISPISLY